MSEKLTRILANSDNGSHETEQEEHEGPVHLIQPIVQGQVFEDAQVLDRSEGAEQQHV